MTTIITRAVIDQAHGIELAAVPDHLGQGPDRRLSAAGKKGMVMP